MIMETEKVTGFVLFLIASIVLIIEYGWIAFLLSFLSLVGVLMNNNK